MRRASCQRPTTERRKGEHHPLRLEGRAQTHLILLLIRQLAQLQPDDLSPDVSREVDDLLRRSEKGFLLLVGATSGVGVGTFAGADGSGGFEVGRAV
jgi:hypothetical protein